MSKTLYLSVSQITEVHEKDVYLRDMTKLYCGDRNTVSKCNAIRIKSIEEDRDKQYVKSVSDIIKKISKVDFTVQISNIREVDHIIDYQKAKTPRHVWQWCKTFAVYTVCFCGVTFAIVTFSNDASVGDVFREVYLVMLRKESPEFAILEMSYSVGLALGITVFSDRSTVAKLSAGPTPAEVEMCPYEDNTNKTLIRNDGGKGSGTDAI